MRDFGESETGPAQPFTTAFLGKTGSGKTTTLNLLTGLSWPTDPVVACTTAPTVAVLHKADHPRLNLSTHRLVDLPGIGESVLADRAYLPCYQEWVTRADRLVYLIQADTRAYKQDQLILSRLRRTFKPGLQVILAVNQVDRLAGFDHQNGDRWSEPTPDQLRYLADRIDDVFDALAEVIGREVTFQKSDVVPYAASHQWGLNGLRRLFFLPQE